MARTLEFDYEVALERATHVFWESGYAGTSLRDLLKQMRIGEGSFYNTLKSKKNAFLECLKHYNATVNRQREEVLLGAPTAAIGIRALFNIVLDCLDDPKTPSRICLMAGSITHEVLADPDLREYVQRQMSMFTERIAMRMAADKEAGFLPNELEPQIVAQVIVAYLQGLWRTALVSYDRPQYEKQIETLLTGLGL